MIPARKTIYKGVTMRSRLEATWAGRMDLAGIPWVYEPCAFGYEGGQYLPDFRIGRAIYLELKGARPEVVPEVLQRMEIIRASEPDASLLLVVDETDEAWFSAGTESLGLRGWRYFFDFDVSRLELVPQESSADPVARVQKLDPTKGVA